jgi:acyl-CoA synthetase (AMP-forming)/AMP-acid ligase II
VDGREGWFFFVDRKKDMIKRAGENVSAFEVEETLSGTRPPRRRCRRRAGRARPGDQGVRDPPRSGERIRERLIVWRRGTPRSGAGGRRRRVPAHVGRKIRNTVLREDLLKAPMGRPPLPSHHAVIGDGRTVALAGLTVPSALPSDLDSGSVFAVVLDAERGGRLLHPRIVQARRYVPDERPETFTPDGVVGH